MLVSGRGEASDFSAWKVSISPPTFVMKKRHTSKGPPVRSPPQKCYLFLWNLPENDHKTSRRSANTQNPRAAVVSDDKQNPDTYGCLNHLVMIEQFNELCMCHFASSCLYQCGCMLDIACDHVGCVCPLSSYVFINYIKEHHLCTYLSLHTNA